MNLQHIISLKAGKRGGRPCIRWIRIAVSDVLGWLASGMSHEEVIHDFPELTEDDIRAGLGFVADRSNDPKALNSIMVRSGPEFAHRYLC